MSTTLLASMAIPALVVIIFILAQISARLYSIHIDLCHIHEDLVRLFARENETRNICSMTKSVKQREYWRDQNGFKHWRKKKDA